MQECPSNCGDRVWCKTDIGHHSTIPSKMMELSRGLRTRPFRINVGPTAALNVVTQNNVFVLAFDGRYKMEIVYRHLLFLTWSPPSLSISYRTKKQKCRCSAIRLSQSSSSCLGHQAFQGTPHFCRYLQICMSNLTKKMFALLGWNTGVGQRMVDSNTRRRRVESSARVEREESRGGCRDEQKSTRG